jgi:Zn-dependent peptidase ImmA (M78 family)
MSKVEVQINPKVIKWAISNSDYDYEFLSQKDNNLEKWINGEKKPTLNQLSNFGNLIHIPFGFLVLKEPPKGPLLGAEYRTIKNNLINKPSRGLEETIFDTEEKMLWMRDYRIEIGAEKLNFLGVYKDKEIEVKNLTEEIRKILGLVEDWATELPTFDKAFAVLKERIENASVLVMKNGIVINNTHRPLDINEFRAFTLYDEYAPVIFINGRDSKGGRNFSLIHEFCHLLFINDDSIFIDEQEKNETEESCNRVAAEFFMPVSLIEKIWSKEFDIDKNIEFISGKLKISQLALAKRLFSYGKITEVKYQEIYRKAIENFNKKNSGGRSGDFISTKMSNLSRTFLRAVIVSAEGGNLLYDEAYKLLNIRNSKSYYELIKKLPLWRK